MTYSVLVTTTLRILFAETDYRFFFFLVGCGVAVSPWVGVRVRINCVRPETVKSESDSETSPKSKWRDAA